MSATDYLARSLYYDIEDEARHGADAERDVLPDPVELGCDVKQCAVRGCYCDRLLKRSRR
jgi:hypothetical protein